MEYLIIYIKNTATIITAFGVIAGILVKFKDRIKNFFVGDIIKEQHQIHIELKRVEILTLIHNHPNERIKISTAYGEYKAFGGNCYINDLYDEWKLKQGVKK